MSGVPENGADGDATRETGMLRRGAAADGASGAGPGLLHAGVGDRPRKPYQAKREE